MPVFKSGKNLAPFWCEMEYFDIVHLNPGQTHSFARVGAKEKIIVGRGRCRLAFDGEQKDVEKGDNVDLRTNEAAFEVLDVAEPTTLIRMAGRWGDDVGGSGLFPVWNDADTTNMGDPVDYPKTTKFDNHFHDCDEYWIIFEGRGVVVSEGKRYEVEAGDCVVTGMGHHHDFPRVFETVLAVFFETTMEGRKRRGHLWNHTHGPAEPVPTRI